MSLSPEEAEQKRQSEAIDRKLRVDLKDFENTIKILLLGQFFMHAKEIFAFACLLLFRSLPGGLPGGYLVSQRGIILFLHVHDPLP